MITKKICMIGDFAVGKTSLVRRYVDSIFSDKYLTSVGVKIDTREVTLDSGSSVKLTIWDIAGGEQLTELEKRYLQGTSGYFLIADGTRDHSIDIALELDDVIQQQLGELPRVLLINKHDLVEKWVRKDDVLAELNSELRPLLLTSALDGENVEHAFSLLTRMMLDE